MKMLYSCCLLDSLIEAMTILHWQRGQEKQINVTIQGYFQTSLHVDGFVIYIV